MKTSVFLTAGLIILFAIPVAIAHAQQVTEPPVKILPTTEKGILKVLYAFDMDKSVEVKFFDKDRVLVLDRIKGKSQSNGFTKKYDVRNLKSEDLWVEISSPSIDVTYKLILSADGHTYEPLLEKTTYNHLMVAAKN
jgi:hypothetical protein